MMLEFDFNQLARIQKNLGATSEQANAAIKRTVTKVTSRVKSRFGKELAALSRADPKQFERARIIIKKSDAGKTGLIWVGLNPISLSNLQPLEFETGVQVRPLFVPNAFIIDKFGGKNGHPVFINKKYPLPAGVVPSEKSSGAKHLHRLDYEWGVAGEAAFQKALEFAEKLIPQIFEQELERAISKT